MSSPIREVLQTLSRQGELVEKALLGVISTDSGAPAPAIVALRQVSALRPVGEEGYRLHPKLREYLQDHLQLFPAFQSLAEIGSKISQMKSLWEEIEMARGHHETLLDLQDVLQTTVLDIGDSMGHNMLLLQSRISTRYGNVRSLREKQGQNRFYQQQTAFLAADLQRLEFVAERVEGEASARSMDDFAAFMRRHLLARLSPWRHGLSEIQTHIRRELFRTRVIEQDLKQLARMDMLLHQQPAWRGFEADLQDDIPVFLLAARLNAIAAHVEPLESDRDVSSEMQSLAHALPALIAPASTEPPKRYERIVDAPAPPPPATPAILALKRLFKDVNSSAGGLSLMHWRERDENARSMAPHIWLVFALAALRANKHRVELLRNAPRDGERFSHTFRDATAYARALQKPNEPDAPVVDLRRVA